MCLAIQQMREESKIEGAVETYKDLGISLVETIKRIAERFQLSENESSEMVKQYWQKDSGCVLGWERIRFSFHPGEPGDRNRILILRHLQL